MLWTAQRGKNLGTAIAAAVVVSAFGAGRAEAQFGFGLGGGFGYFGGFGGAVPQPVDFVNSVALARMSHVQRPPGATPGSTGATPYAGNPNAYFNHVRDNGFVDSYNPYRREPSYTRPPASVQGQRTTPTAMTVARSKPAVPLVSFFNPQDQLVWPADAPTADALQQKRATFDQAARAVLDELRKNDVAAVATVSEARQKLLDYGRPALQDVRTHETPRVADSFHVFLLELYDSLAQAASPRGMAAAPPPASGRSS
jgi:hypothetical protein